jgi:hypothetical protein
MKKLFTTNRDGFINLVEKVVNFMHQLIFK